MKKTIPVINFTILLLISFSCSHTPENMVEIPAGTFLMGSEHGRDNEKPVHSVQLDAFYMDKYEVSVEDYQAFIEATNHRKPELWSEQLKKPSRPVVLVFYDDAKSYASWAGKRLPTEAEWEYAARGGHELKRYPWGNESPQGKANYDKDTSRWLSWSATDKYLMDITSFEPNNYGLYNMSGNVWEICSDWYDESYYKTLAEVPAKNPRGPEDGRYRVIRGGGWFRDDSNAITVSFRGAVPAGDEASFSTGFRCVQDVISKNKKTSKNKLTLGLSDVNKKEDGSNYLVSHSDLIAVIEFKNVPSYDILDFESIPTKANASIIKLVKGNENENVIVKNRIDKENGEYTIHAIHNTRYFAFLKRDGDEYSIVQLEGFEGLTEITNGRLTPFGWERFKDPTDIDLPPEIERATVKSSVGYSNIPVVELIAEINKILEKAK